MIRNFGDHSANERTFLAWVRTAIAVMAFGFLVEKFDLFLETGAPSLPGQRFGNVAGLALIVLGTAMIAVAAIRFLLAAKKIDGAELRAGPGSQLDLALAALLVLLGSALFIYLSHALVTKL
jgi:putative membrane protein